MALDMSKGNGFLQLRRGVFEHILDGRMSLADFAIYSYIIGQADTRTGVWNGSAGALAGELSISSRLARKLLERLSRAGYIRRFAVPGKHICYPILVHKFTVTNGEHRGEQLNATLSTSPTDLRYVPGEQVGELRGEHVGELGASQKILEKGEGETREKNQKIESPSPAPQAPTSHPLLEIRNQNRGQLAEATSSAGDALPSADSESVISAWSAFGRQSARRLQRPSVSVNDRGWKADFDWLIANDTNVLKVLEGKYDGQSQEPVWKQMQTT